MLCVLHSLICIYTYYTLYTAVAVSALVKKKAASLIMDALEATGATDILLFAINNSRM